MKALSISMYFVCFFLATTVISTLIASGVFLDTTALAGLPIYNSTDSFQQSLDSFTNTFSYENAHQNILGFIVESTIGGFQLLLSLIMLIFNTVGFLPSLLTFYGAPSVLVTAITTLLVIVFAISLFGIITGKQTRYIQ